MPRRTDARFADSTRGRIVGLLRRSPRTVEELASALELTDNAVRLHLSTLERDGIVVPRGVRREGTVGKPATEYEIALEAELDFSDAYIPFLKSLLTTLGRKLSPAELKSVMREAGKTLAGSAEAKGGDVGERTRRASQLL